MKLNALRCRWQCHPFEQHTPRKQNIIFYDHKDEKSTRRYKCETFNLIQGDKEHVRSLQTGKLTNTRIFGQKIARERKSQSTRIVADLGAERDKERRS